MNDHSSDRNYDLTQAGSDRGNQQATRIARERESDDVNENSSLGNVTGPEGDSAAENKVATSLSDE